MRNKELEILEDKTNQYLEWCANTPLIKTESFIDDHGVKRTVSYDTERPYSIDEWCEWLGITKEFLFSLMNTGQDKYVFIDMAFSLVFSSVLDLVAIEALQLEIGFEMIDIRNKYYCS